jgi:hypothetical protein
MVGCKKVVGFFDEIPSTILANRSQVTYHAGVMAKKKVRKPDQFGPPTLQAGVALEGYGVLRESEAARIERDRVMADWLVAYREGGWSHAEAETGVEVGRVQGWLTLIPSFRAAFNEAQQATADRLERVADAIASGEAAATPAQVQMLQFRLRGLRPDTYRERASVQVDQRTTLGVEGDGSRARLLLAEWGGTAAASPAPPAAIDGGGIARAALDLARRREAADGDGAG